MHVQHLSISPIAANNRSHNDELLLGDEIPYAALIAGGLVAGMGLDVELQGGDEGEACQEQ